MQKGEVLFNAYAVDRHVGAGAFAEVYRVVDVELHVPRAIKVLRRDKPGLGSTKFDEYDERFRLEGQIGARISHPNVIAVHAFHRTPDDGGLALVMEFAPGGNLRDRLADLQDEGNRVMSVEEALRTAIDIADGLGAIHGLDVVHRDLKPSNILFDAKHRAKVGDLGLAQVPENISRRVVGAPGQRHPGTDEYASPEQLTSTQALTLASDVFALGAILFEILTGRQRYQQRPDARARYLRPDVPEWLDDLVAQMLDPDPSHRPWNGAEVALALRCGLEKSTRARADRSDETACVRALESELESARQDAATWRARGERAEAELAAQMPLREEVTRWRTRAETAERLLAAVSADVAESSPRAPRDLSPCERAGIEFVRVPLGVRALASSIATAEGSDLWISRTPITNEQYRTYVVDARARAPGHWRAGHAPAGLEDHPVVFVSWHEVAAFCSWAGVALPTEAEWLAVASGADHRTFPWGNDWADDCCNSSEAGIGGTTPVTRFAHGRSPDGVLDLCGNVWEWCSDWFDDARERRVVRGGAFSLDREHVRCDARAGYDADFRSAQVGFRVVRRQDASD